MHCTFTAIIQILSIDIDLELGLKVRMVCAIPGTSDGDSPLGYSSTIIDGLTIVILIAISREHADWSMIPLVKLIMLAFVVLLVDISLSDGCVVDILLVGVDGELDSFSEEIVLTLEHFLIFCS